MPGAKYAVLVAVEQYQQTNILGVPFAIADVKAMKDVLTEQMQVPDVNITVWINEDATRSCLENELPYVIRQLRPDDQFIFFYAGHGFYIKGSNRLTTWDTHALNIGETTACLDKVLLSPLKSSHCKKSLVFIDACATNFGDASMLSRDFVLGMHFAEFAEFVKSTEYRAAFFSCSPTQQSYSWPALKHGIWTYHLLRALRGEDKDAFEGDRHITGNSLQTYLARIVPTFIKNETDIKATQRPYAELAANGAFEILQVPESAVTVDDQQLLTREMLGATVAVANSPTHDLPAIPQIKTVLALPSDIEITAAQKEYREQRKRLPETDVTKKIWTLPHWRIWSRPLDFRKARFQSLDHCAHFVASNTVWSNARWTMYPWFNNPIEHGVESVTAEIDFVERDVEHTERWVLFQSGQFVHNMALDRMPQLGKRTHVLEILDVTTALFEFIARMADKNVFTNHISIAFELISVAGRQLSWGDDLDGWCQDESIGFDNIYTAEEMRGSRRKLALDAALEIYTHFNWNNPPIDKLREVQKQHFG